MKFYIGAINQINSDINMIETGIKKHKELLDHLDPKVRKFWKRNIIYLQNKIFQVEKLRVQTEQAIKNILEAATVRLTIEIKN